MGSRMETEGKWAKGRTETTYGAAADSFDDPANGYWSAFGERTVERLSLPPGGNVLDVACGSGASALPAARAVGRSGSVLAVDLTEELLALGREKADQEGLHHLEFRRGDMTRLDLPAASFDAVLCVFGVFFVEDMEGLARGLWTLVRPGGSLAITTWGPDLFEPMYAAFDTAVAKERPELVSERRPWDRLTSPSAVQDLLLAAGAPAAEAVAEEGSWPLGSTDSWWKVVLGSGLRGVVESLGATSAARVREETASFGASNQVTRIATNVIYGTARKTPEP